MHAFRWRIRSIIHIYQPKGLFDLTLVDNGSIIERLPLSGARVLHYAPFTAGDVADRRSSTRHTTHYAAYHICRLDPHDSCVSLRGFFSRPTMMPEEVML